MKGYIFYPFTGALLCEHRRTGKDETKRTNEIEGTFPYTMPDVDSPTFAAYPLTKRKVCSFLVIYRTHVASLTPVLAVRLVAHARILPRAV